MSVIIHAADLHISEQEKEYSFSVLEEIIDISCKYNADFVIFAGDFFNTYKAAAAFRCEFRECIDRLDKGIEVFYLPGNHESLGAGRNQLGNLDLGRITLLETKPWSLLSRGNIEILAVPHQDSYGDYRKWEVPLPARGAFRIAIMHGEVEGMSFSGWEEEAGGAVIDPDLFTVHHINYAALGHIHSRRSETVEKSFLGYPGSARVWRKGECGRRGINLVDTGKKDAVRFIPLKRAGEYRKIDIPVNFDGIPEWPENFTSCWTVFDWVDIRLSGVVENEKNVAVQAEKLERKYGPKIRRLDLSRKDIAVLSGIASEPIAKKFLHLWKKREPPPGDDRARRIWLESREMAMHEIKALLEARE